jgi:hypothetical protein
MPEITIKLEADLVEKVTALKPKGESITGYVRELIEREHRARVNRDAANIYQQFLQENPDERAAMEAWEASRE